jgi:hypothetical protein
MAFKGAKPFNPREARLFRRDLWVGGILVVDETFLV